MSNQEPQYTVRHEPGVCSQACQFDIDDAGALHNVRFFGGCNGNLQGIGRLVEGMDAADVAERLAGTRCGMRPSSCPDQLSKAVSKVLAERE